MKKLVLVGSGEFTSSMLKIDSYLINEIKNPTSPPTLLKHRGSRRLRRTGSKVNVAIIPTASVPDGKQQKWIDDGIKHFKKLGVNPFGLNIVNRQDANKKAFLKKLKAADLIYFSGGHPGFLLETFKDTEAWKVILNLYEQGIILAGSSAGAMIMGSYLLANAQESFDKGVKPKWIKGFNLASYTIFPHYDWAVKNRPADMKRVLSLAPKYIKDNWMGIDEDTALIFQDNKKMEIKGDGTVVFHKI